MGFLSKLRKVLGVITDVLTFGRGKGWWQKKDEPFKRPKRGQG